MLLRPFTLGCGAAFALILLYLGRMRHVGVEKGHSLNIPSSQQDYSLNTPSPPENHTLNPASPQKDHPVNAPSAQEEHPLNAPAIREDHPLNVPLPQENHVVNAPSPPQDQPTDTSSPPQDATANKTAIAVIPVTPSEIANPEEIYSIDPLISNSTLGFEKILAVNLPSRPDRRDVMTLMADHTDVHIEWIDAIRGRDMNKKAWPDHWNSKTAGLEHANLSMGYLGGWRTHLNCIRRVVEEGWNTALILEDDADWDVNIKSQMQQFANRSRTLGNARHDPSDWITSDTPTNNPYGEEWDILWLGPCLNPPGPPDSQIFPGEDGQQAHWVYYAPGYLECTWGYAITQKSARKLLGWLLDVSAPVDVAMSQYCEYNPCIVVWPELIGSYRPAGGNAKGSDNRPDSEQGEVLEKGWTRNVVHSATVEVLEKYGHHGPWPP